MLILQGASLVQQLGLRAKDAETFSTLSDL